MVFINRDIFSLQIVNFLLKLEPRFENHFVKK